MGDYLLPNQLAAKCGLSEEEVRAFEERGVIHGVTKNGYRYYSARDCYRLRGIVRLMRDKGLPFAKAQALVDEVRRATPAVGR
jgi:DNA-binding transcriptional MerR regulator